MQQTDRIDLLVLNCSVLIAPTVFLEETSLPLHLRLHYEACLEAEQHRNMTCTTMTHTARHNTEPWR